MSDSTTTGDSIHPNHNCKNGRRRTREERGLPEDDALKKPARLYLETQRRLWPELARVAPYAKFHDQDVAAMAEAFKAQFLVCKLGDHHIARPKTATAGMDNRIERPGAAGSYAAVHPVFGGGCPAGHGG
ncbi:MAG: hypothetical protein R3C45_12730 [Phycisphaerales bacterium]